MLSRLEPDTSLIASRHYPWKSSNTLAQLRIIFTGKTVRLQVYPMVQTGTTIDILLLLDNDIIMIELFLQVKLSDFKLILTRNGIHSEFQQV